MKWIPAAQRLPPTQKRVLIAYTTHHGKRAVTIGWYCRAKSLDSGAFESEVDDEYDAASDTYYLKEQWVDESVESEYHYPISGVTHWAELPRMPDEE